MITLRVKAEALLFAAQSIEDENYFDDVTAEEQRRLEAVVSGVRAAANLLILHVNDIDRQAASFDEFRSKRKILPRPSGKRKPTKLRVVK
jgi:hypothetical protein